MVSLEIQSRNHAERLGVRFCGRGVGMSVAQSAEKARAAELAHGSAAALEGLGMLRLRVQ